MPRNHIRVNVYEILSRAVEEGLAAGWRRAHKYTDDPGEDAIRDQQHHEIMAALAEVVVFGEGE